MYRIRTTAVAIATLTAATATLAPAQTTINFDSFVARTFSSGTLVQPEHRLSDQLRSSGVLFRSNDDYVAVVNLGLNHATSGRNGIGGVTSAGILSYAAPISIAFWNPTVARQKGVTDFVEIRGDLIPTSGIMTMKAFDVFGALLGTVNVTDAGGTYLRYSGPNVHRVEISSNTANVAFDDLTFNPINASTVDIDIEFDPNDPIVRGNPSTTVPEPSSFAMLGGGALLLGLVARRRRRAPQP